MGEIVDGGSDAWVCEIAEHEEIWSEEENSEEQPTEMKVLISEDGG